MAFEVFDDVAFYWFLLAALVVFVVPMTYSFVSVLNLRAPKDWTRGVTSCKAKLAAVDARRYRETRQKVFGWRGLGFVVGWFGLIYLATSFATMQVRFRGTVGRLFRMIRLQCA